MGEQGGADQRSGSGKSTASVGHPSAGSFGRNAAQETHNGARCASRRDDSCLLAPRGDRGNGYGRDWWSSLC